MSLTRWVDKTAVVTGATTGFGRAIASRLIRGGMKVAALGTKLNILEQNREKLNKKDNYFPLKVDLRNEEETIKGFEWIKKNVGPIHVLVNNAGVLIPSPLTTGDTKGWRDTINVNVLGLCICTREAIKDMLKNKINGHVVHVCSITGHYVPYVPGWSVYPATKHAVTALTETMRQELNYMDSQIKISQISPGFAVTEIAKHVKKGDAIYQSVNNSKMTAEDVAEGVAYILSTPPHLQIHDLIIRPVGEKA